MTEELLLALGGLTLGGSAGVLVLSAAGRVWRYGARWRCWAWLLLCLRLALPLPLLPQAEVQAPIRVELPASPPPVQTLPNPSPVPAPEPDGPAGTPLEGAQPPPKEEEPEENVPDAPWTLPAVTPARVVLGLWLAGAAVMLGWSALAHLRFLAYLRRWSQPVRDGEVIAAFNRAGDLLKLHSRPRLLVCQGLRVPMLAGVLRPALLLPQREDWTWEELNCSLLHELTHCRRRDIWLKTLAMWVNALHWFNPLAWYMVRAVERDTELACDEDVLRQLPAEQRAAYGRTILSAVERMSNGRHGPTREM